MGNTLIILLGYVITFILIIVIISLLLRIRNIERKLVNFTPTEAYTIMENMHQIILESQRLADSLEAAIKQKEAVLEDLSDLVDEKIVRLERASGEKYSPPVKKESLSEKNIFEETFKKPPLKEIPDFNQNTLNASKTVSAPKTAQQNNIQAKTDKKSKIIMLHNEGRADIDIARELGISVTEVQLALRLLPKA